MNKALRKAVIAGNWKMNKTPAEAKELIAAIAPLVKDAGCEVVACTPFVDLSAAQEAAQGTNIQIGAENCHWEVSGAYTGEVSAQMLTSMGVNIVIIGHSERRQYFGETDVTVQKRVRASSAWAKPWSSGSRASPASWLPCRPRSPSAAFLRKS